MTAKRENCEGIVWPEVSGDRRSVVSSLVAQFEETQWMPPSELARRQFEQLSVLARHAAAFAPFYRRRLAPLLPEDGRAITAADLARVPILTRQDLQNHEGQIRASSYPESHGTAGEIRSSGSTGHPVGVLVPDITRLFYAALTLRYHRWHQKDFTAEIAAIRQLRGDEASVGEEQPLPWIPALDAGPMYLYDITKPVSGQLAWLRKRDPVYVLTYPSNLRDLLRYSRKIAYRPPRLAAVNTMSEIVDDGLRELCRDVWNVPIVDAYSAIEAGMIALQCPDHPHYHVQSENVLVEVVGGDGKPCLPGESGRLLITDLHNFATPLIRYEIGDFAEQGAACSCGRSLPVLSRIRGRTRNMVRFPTGGSAWPIAWKSSDLHEYGEIQQIQMIQRVIDRIDVNLVIGSPLGHDDEARLAQYFSEMLGYPFQFEFHYVDEIRKSSGGKFEDFICRVP